ncbi:hypothetical protein WR25_10907 [Diploscapter pachys]|uniref:Uncharacterized protein n=1 Tax=Diploscapter pachys TaxID=2018661 RepID=A0A2A2K7T1_9BILA|nr:hypothetical protein WR25_10907 [Diploscapter pachys]
MIHLAKSFEAIKAWLKSTELSECVRVESVKIEDTIETLGLNPFVRHGFRTLTNLTRNAMMKDAEAKADYFFHEMTASATTVVEEKLTLLFRVEEEIKHVRELIEDLLNERILQDVYKVGFEPFVKSAPSACHRPSLTETCQCLFELKR